MKTENTLQLTNIELVDKNAKLLNALSNIIQCLKKEDADYWEPQIEECQELINND